MVLTAALAIGGTLAYMTSITETKKNVFTSDQGLKGKIEETFDEETAKKYIPGEAIVKSPYFLLEKGDSAYVAATITCKNSNGVEIPLSDFEAKYGKIYYNVDGTIQVDTSPFKISGTVKEGINPVWQLIEGTDNLYKYCDSDGALTKITTNQTTTPMFDEVVVLAQIQEILNTNYSTKTIYEQYYNNDGDLAWREVDKTSHTWSSANRYFEDANGKKELVDAAVLPSFSIDVQGYMVQAENIEEVEAITELKKLAGKKTSATGTTD